MTREIRVNTNSFRREATSAHTANCDSKSSAVSSTSFFAKICTAYTKAIKVKREISSTFVSITRELGDKTAREGLFGEDKGKNYLGTSVDYPVD